MFDGGALGAVMTTPVPMSTGCGMGHNEMMMTAIITMVFMVCCPFVR